MKIFSWSLTTSTFGTWTGDFNYPLLEEKNYLFSLDLNASGQPAVYVYVGTGKPQGASVDVRMVDEVDGSLQSGGMRELVDEIPLDIPRKIFASSKKSFSVIGK